MSALTPSARNMIEMMQGDRILLQSDVLSNLIIIFGENLRRQQSIEKHPFEKENYIMLLLTIRSFTKTIISNSFFGYYHSLFVKAVLLTNVSRGVLCLNYVITWGNYFLKLCAEYHNNVCLDQKTLLSNLYDTWLTCLASYLISSF